jgi:hypothetical protein
VYSVLEKRSGSATNVITMMLRSLLEVEALVIYMHSTIHTKGHIQSGSAMAQMHRKLLTVSKKVYFPMCSISVI